MKRALAYGGFCLLDHGVWLLIQLLPGPVLIGLARQRVRSSQLIRACHWC